MKVLLVNGSPNGHGCTYTALKEIEKTLRAEGVETEMFYLGNKPIGGCLGCGACKKLGKCVQEDVVNKLLPKALEADGIVLGAPVHYASAAGQASCAYDRLFVMSNGSFANKLGAAVVSCRRGGATATFDQLNKYFTISNMPVVSGTYWNQVHGNTPDEVKQDLEGMQNMRASKTTGTADIPTAQATGRESVLAVRCPRQAGCSKGNSRKPPATRRPPFCRATLKTATAKNV